MQTRLLITNRLMRLGTRVVGGVLRSLRARRLLFYALYIHTTVYLGLGPVLGDRNHRTGDDAIGVFWPTARIASAYRVLIVTPPKFKRFENVSCVWNVDPNPLVTKLL